MPADKEALKAKRLEQLRLGRLAAAKRRAEGVTEPSKKIPDTPPPAKPDTKPFDVPPPLPPLGGPLPGESAGAPPVNSAAGFLPQAQAKVIGKIGNNYFKGMTTGLNFVMPKNLTLEISDLEEGEEELLGTFMLPVIEKWLPKFKESPEYALGVVAVGLYLGKIKVKKIERVTNLGATPPVESAPPEKDSNAVAPVPDSPGVAPSFIKPRGLNLGNLEER